MHEAPNSRNGECTGFARVSDVFFLGCACSFPFGATCSVSKEVRLWLLCSLIGEIKYIFFDTRKQCKSRLTRTRFFPLFCLCFVVVVCLFCFVFVYAQYKTITESFS